MSSYKLLKLSISIVLFCFYIVKSSEVNKLKVEFYKKKCSCAEFIVKDEVMNGFISNNILAAALLRLHFHDCFVRGCDGSVLIESTQLNTAEKDAPPNNPSLPPKAFEVIDKAKARLEDKCPGVVSCADILAFAARDSINLTGGPHYGVPAGRRDGRVSLASEALSNLPPPTFNLTQLTKSFADKGLTQSDMVILSGAHTIGESRCSSFANRLYNYSKNESQDPTLNPKYAAQLKQMCPRELKNASRAVAMDPTPTHIDVEYYRSVLDGKGLFTSDQTLLTSKQTRDQVVKIVQNPDPWKIKFVDAMVKMGSIEVLTGKDGEIRANCRVINGGRKS